MFNLKRNIYKPAKRIKKRVVRGFKTLYDRIFFKRYLQNHIPVLVLQMGKVASKSVYKSLCQYHTRIVLHAHNFNANHTDWRVRRLYHWVVGGAMPLIVISLIRDPISRNISAFFENFEKIAAVPYHKANFSLEELKEIFLAKYNHEQPLRWFDKNIKKNFGIDVFASSFPECGYDAYLHNNIKLLVMRSELSDKEKSKVLSDFIGLSGFQLINSNIGDEKVYGMTYKDFKKNVKLPLDYIEKMCKSKYFNHFYDKCYIDYIRKKWSDI